MIFLLILNLTVLNPPEILRYKDTVIITFDVKGPLKYDKSLKSYNLEFKFENLDSALSFSSQINHPLLKGITVKKEKKNILLNLELGYFCKKYRIENKKDYFRVTLLGEVPDSIYRKKEKKEEKPVEIEESKKVIREIKKIVIDPGHGGQDAGAIGRKGTKEKNVNLAVAKYLKKELEKMGFEVYLTRNKDTFITLGARTRFANKVGADLFVSLHCNASRRVTKTSNGVEVYFLSEAKTDWERAVAALENASIKYEFPEQKVPDGVIEAILMDMAQTEFLFESQKLAEILQKTISKKTGMWDRGMKQAGFYVLNGCYSPAVLVEMGFITTPKEEKLLRSKRFQKKIAKAIAEGIKKFKDWFEKKNGFAK